MMINFELEEARRHLNDLMNDKPFISCSPLFDVQKHIEYVQWWREEVRKAKKKVDELERVHFPELIIKREEEDRKKKIWMAKHYPN